MEDVDLLTELKGKKKKRPRSRPEISVDPAPPQTDGNVSDDSDYTYTWLLNRVYRNPVVSRDERTHFPPPKVVREGTRKTVWCNFGEFIAKCHRPVEHVQRFCSSELSVQCSQTQGGALCLKGGFNSREIQSQCRKYISSFVLCSNCKGSDTLLEHDSQTRLNFISCQLCFARRSVQNITKGFMPDPKRQRERREEDV